MVCEQEVQQDQRRLVNALAVVRDTQRATLKERLQLRQRDDIQAKRSEIASDKARANEVKDLVRTQGGGSASSPSRQRRDRNDIRVPDSCSYGHRIRWDMVLSWK